MCKLCKHPDRVEIEQAILNNEVKRHEVAFYIGDEISTVNEHMKSHLTDEVKKGDRIEHIDSMLTLETLASQLRMMILSLKKGNKIYPKTDLLKTIRELRETLRVISEIRKEITTDVNVNINQDLELFFKAVKDVLTSEGSGELWNKIKEAYNTKKGESGEVEENRQVNEED